MLLIAFLTFEAGLRIVPMAIPTNTLRYVEPAIRKKVATGRFSTTDDMVMLERDDHGANLRVFNPFGLVRNGDDDLPGCVHEVRVDEQGFSNPPGSYRNQIDIVCIGDSFTFAHAVVPKDAWACQLGPLTGRTSYNLGMGGTGLYEYIQYLKLYGLSRKPKIVVMNVYEGNDLRDAVRHYHAAAGQGDMDELKPEAWHASILGRNSYAYNFIRGSISYLADRSDELAAKESIDYRFDIGSIPFNRAQSSRDEVVYAQWQREGKYGFELFEAALTVFAELAREHGFDPILTYSPWGHQAYTSVKFHDPAIGRTLAAFSRDQRAFFARRSSELGLRFLDLGIALRAASGEPTWDNLMYYPTSIHYSKRANDIVARAIAALIQK